MTVLERISKIKADEGINDSIRLTSCEFHTMMIEKDSDDSDMIVGFYSEKGTKEFIFDLMSKSFCRTTGCDLTNEELKNLLKIEL